MSNDYEKALEKLNQEYKELLESTEYRTGKRVLKFKYYLKKGKLITLVKKVLENKKKQNINVMDNAANKELFVNNEKNIIGTFDENEKIAVYTVNIGGYDRLVQPLYKSPNVDFFVVSDVKPKDLGLWQWLDANKYVSKLDTSNVKKARYIKTHPQEIFPNYKYSIFIDGNIKCVTDVSQIIKKLNKKTKIAIHPHPCRDCIYKEIVALKVLGRGNYPVMLEQLNEYEKEGMPRNFGLFETNVFAREHNDPVCIDIMNKWWNEIETKSERDQMSFTYVLWKNGYVANDIGVIYDSIKNNPIVQVVDHLEVYEK